MPPKLLVVPGFGDLVRSIHQEFAHRSVPGIDWDSLLSSLSYLLPWHDIERQRNKMHLPVILPFVPAIVVCFEAFHRTPPSNQSAP